jgi:hypothetical protein
VLRQWQEEMASRFGLAFTVMDRAYVAKVWRGITKRRSPLLRIRWPDSLTTR